jgi:uncharacterized membrane protein SirB2
LAEWANNTAINPVLLIHHTCTTISFSGAGNHDFQDNIQKNLRNHLSIIAVKYLHLSCVLLSYTLFFLRGVWMLRAAPILQQRLVKVLPHVVDTVLLLSAITLAFQLSISPLSNPWLMAKIIALLLYIVLGTIALKRGKTRKVRLAAWLSAQLVFIYIVAVALTHNPQPWQTLYN